MMGRILEDGLPISSPRYARRRMALVACPFCREMFEQGEAKECPVCGMALVAFEKLPPSRETHDEFGLPHQPEHEPLPWTYVKRERGLLTTLALVGLGLFFLPWIHQTLPYDLDLSGFTLSRRLGWVWGAGVGWLVLVPTVLSRRTIAQMRGARVAAAFLSAASLVACLVLYLRPPHGVHYKPHFTFTPAFWVTMLVSLAATVVSLRFGGKLEEIAVRRGAAPAGGRTLH